MKIFTFHRNQPILDIEVEQTKGVNYGSKYGLNRDRNPDGGWDQLRNTRMDYAEEVELTPELKKTLLEDLAYAYGHDSNKFSEKLIEFNLL